jgi:8-oxo-dGTP pyrophosphatase MutT (NUDIX family)
VTPVTPVAPKPAASVLLVRSGQRGPVEVYMIRRQKSMRFLGGYYAFPGGKVDPDDGAPEILTRCRGVTEAQAERLVPRAGVLPALAFWVAAARELLEETGVLMACDASGRPVAESSPGAAARLDAFRTAHMAQDAPLHTLLEAEDWYLDLGPFRYLSHFITPPSSPIRFTARFYLAPVPAGQSPRLFDEEASEGFWVEAGEGFRRHQSGEWAMAEPADCGLGYLAQFDGVDAVWAAHDDGRHKFHGILDRVESQGVDLHRHADGRTPAAP